MLSNLMNLGKKKPSSLENPEKCVDTSGEEWSRAHGSFEGTVSPTSKRSCEPLRTGLSVGLFWD